MTIEIEALDTLFFRDSKPFNMGDDAWANGMFPPLPSVIYGALRTAYMAQNNISIDNIIEATKDFRITQIAYSIGGQDYFPLPLDLVGDSKIIDKKEKDYLKKQTKATERKLPAFSLSTNQSNLVSHLKDTEKLFYIDAEKSPEIENIEEGIMDNSSLSTYLNSNETNFEDIIRMSSFMKPEPKIGIGRKNETHTTEEGNLYRINLSRPSQLKIRIEFDGLENLADKGLLKLGAESKLATYKREKRSNIDVSNIDCTSVTEFKIYLATPAIFEKGYYPTSFFKNAGVEVELITCAVGKYINVAGFDMQERKPKTMQKAVPAGSVYYYRLKNGNLQDLVNFLKMNNGISEYRQNEGFGLAYLGKI